MYYEMLYWLFFVISFGSFICSLVLLADKILFQKTTWTKLEVALIFFLVAMIGLFVSAIQIFMLNFQ